MIEIDYSAVGTRIAKFRKANGLTAAQLAEMAGPPLTREILAKIESGRRSTLDVALIMSIAWALKVSPVAILLPLNNPDTVVEPDSQLRVRDVVDWFAGWPETGPARVANNTPAGLTTSRQLLGMKTLARREANVAAAQQSLREAEAARDDVKIIQLNDVIRDLIEDLVLTQNALADAGTEFP